MVGENFPPFVDVGGKEITGLSGGVERILEIFLDECIVASPVEEVDDKGDRHDCHACQ